MIVSFTGSQSSGKSTLLNLAAKDEYFEHWHIVPEVTRVVKRMGFDINEIGTNETQLFILAEHLKNHHIRGDVMLDRCIVDGLVYTLYLCYNKQIDRWVEQYARRLFETLTERVDIIFYTDHNIPLVDDGERSANKRFRDDIINIFNTVLRNPLISNKVVKLSGTIDERYLIFKQTIENELKIR